MKKRMGILVTAIFLLITLVACSSERLNESSTVSTISKEPKPESYSKSSNPNINVASSLDEKLVAIEQDFDNTITDFSTKLEIIYQEVSDYEKYLDSPDTIVDFYNFVLDESQKLFIRTADNAVDYYKLVVSSIDHDKTGTMDDAMEEFYDTIYEDAFDEFYDTVYEDIFEDIYDKYYEGIIKESEDSTDYSSWLSIHSDFYENWLDVHSDLYSLWLEAHSDLYEDYLDVKSAFWDKEYDIDSVLKRSIKKRSKAASNFESTPEPTPAPESQPASAPQAESEPQQETGMRPEFKEAMDSYEAFMNEYVEFMKKYKESPNDLSLLADYTKFLSEYSDMTEKFNAWGEGELSDEELSYYIDVSARIQKKLLEVA